MKKKLALVLAAAMALTSLPTVAFAQSSNSISTVVSAKEDTKLARTGSGAAASAPGYIPLLQITSDSKIPITRGSKYRLHLTNAEWLNETKTSADNYYQERLLRSTDFTVSHKDGVSGVNLSENDISVEYIDARTIEVTLGKNTTYTYQDYPYASPVQNPTPKTLTNGTALPNFNINDPSGVYDVANIVPAANGVYNLLVTEKNNLNFGGMYASLETDLADEFDGLTNGAEVPNGDYSGGETGNIKFETTNNYFSVNKTTNAADEVRFELGNGSANSLLSQLTGIEGQVDFFKDLDYQEIYITWDEITTVNTGGASNGTDDTVVLTKHDAVIYLSPFTNAVWKDTANGTPNTDASPINGDTVITMPMLVELTGTGDAIVRIESVSGNVSVGSPLTFANVSEGNVKVTVSKTVTIPETGKELENIIINEVTPGSLDKETYLRLRAPSNFYWSATTDAKVTTAGFYAGKGEVDINGSVTSGGTTTKITTGLGDKNTNEIQIDISGLALNKSTTIGTLIISGLIIKPTDDARFGDVNVTVRGGKISSTSVLVGAYKDYVVTMEAEDKDLPVILAGYMPGYANNSDVLNEEDVRALELHIEEAVPNSWWGLRKTLLSVPDGVQIRGAEIKFTKGSNYEELVDEYAATVDLSKISSPGKFTEGEVTIYDGERLEFKGLKMKDDQKAEVWIKLYLSVEPGFTGDIQATLSGGGLDEDISATIATAVNPVNVSMKQTEIKLGYKNIELNDITITENKAGAIRKEYYKLPSLASGSTTYGNGAKTSAKMILQIGDTTDNQYLKFDSIKSYEVTEGDLVLDSVKVRSGNIEIEVKNESDKPSTIVLKGVTGLADRVPPEGYYALSIGGDAVINNYNEDKAINGEFDTQFFEVPKAYNVITAAPGSANEFNTYVQMKIDDTTMIVGSDVIEMDAAPYISEGRTMLPIRYVANAFGISDDNIHFDQNSKTVTLVTQNRTVQLTVGSRTILSNGTPIEMDVAAEITDGRTFIPVMWVATALGISQPVWDEATRTVTFNGEYASNDALGSEVASNNDATEVSSDDEE